LKKPVDLFSFVATVVLVTASGALAPGPLFFATISHGVRSGAKSGLIFSTAHALVEFTLIMLFAFGLLSVANYPPIKLTIGVVGGFVLLLFGALQVRDSLKVGKNGAKTRSISGKNLLFLGITFTGLNPFFILWWLTVGANLILMALEFASFAGVIFMFICHVWIDIVWLTLVAHLSKIGTNVAGYRWYRVLMAIFGLVLIYFGTVFVLDSLTELL
jgi:threonine/homoserine/homoserine lactone efflux protein